MVHLHRGNIMVHVWRLSVEAVTERDAKETVWAARALPRRRAAVGDDGALDAAGPGKARGSVLRFGAGSATRDSWQRMPVVWESRRTPGHRANAPTPSRATHTRQICL